MLSTSFVYEEVEPDPIMLCDQTTGQKWLSWQWSIWEGHTCIQHQYIA